MPSANSKDPDQPEHPRSLVRAFVVRFLDGITPLVSISEIPRHLLASEADQAGLYLNRSQTPETGVLVTRLTSLTFVFLSRLVTWAGYGN